ncbi:tyrosine-type recombinase/integrase [Peribacillus asahii]|uniref:tyrosine-type recombinase/integrase n=1 Tax=Peribacillus asahii TaxID=228899 RepID=UPI002079DB3B|nr:site-specific integrase [Peribacillus asahii]USK62462.1 site-specific integrase [Peribacillus asahii]
MKGEISKNNSLIESKGNYLNIPRVTENLLNTNLYHQLQDRIDESGTNDYSQFNDLEMLYLHVHKRKSVRADDERMGNTKKEMIRDLLIFYNQLIEHQLEFEIHESHMNVYSLLKGLNERNIRKYEEWIEHAPLGKGGKPYAKATLSRKTVIVKGFFSFLYNEGYIAIPLHQKMKSSHVTDKDRPNRDLSSVEVEAILSHYQEHPIIHTLVAVLATTGLRIQELCTARVCDLSFYKGEYWLKVMGKGRKQREVLIHPPIYEAIVRCRKRRGLELEIDAADTTPLFVTAKNKAYSYKYLSNYLTQKMNAVPADIIQKRSTPITPHHIRHFYAIESAELGVDLLKIMMSLGHSSTKTTMIYLEKTLARKNHASHAWSNSSFLKNLK